MPEPNEPEGKPAANKKAILGIEERARLVLDSLPDVATPPPGELFDQGQAQAYSCYSGICQPQEGDDVFGQKLLRVIPPDRLWPNKDDKPIPPQGEIAHDTLRGFILNEYYPCLGARAAISQGTYRFGFYKQMGHLSAVAAMGRDLRRFAQEYEQIGHFATFLAVFKRPQVSTEEDFEALLWQHLQMLHDNDINEWDPHYSPDPTSSDFGFSFYGKAFFVVGINPAASRSSRRFGFCVLVFNPESQIRRLKEQAKLDQFAHAVRQRDILLQGSINPSLPKDTESSGGEARVYSGKAHYHGDGWKCPFQPRKAVLAEYRARHAPQP